MRPMLDLQPIKARLAAATPGPWEVESSETVDGSFIANMGPIMIVPYFQGMAPMMADADLIAHAPTDLAALVAEVERLRTAITEHERLLRRGDHYGPADVDLWAVLDA